MSSPENRVGGIGLGRWLGVQVRVDWSLLLIFALIVFQLGAGAWPDAHPEWTTGLRWAMAVAAGVAFFVTVLLHELSHAVVARRLGVEVRGIVLFLFGGMSLMRGRPKRASHELLIAAAGPLMSVAIGALSLFLLGATVSTDLESLDPEKAMASLSPGQTLLAWLGPINLMLAAFNLIPGFPLDGGRLLRAGIWYATGDVRKATRWATTAGKATAMLLMAIGLSMVLGIHMPVFGTGLGPGLWLLLIGWFLYAAAQASLVQSVAQEDLAGVRVGELMRSELRTVDPGDTIQDVVHDKVLGTHQKSFPVVRDGRFLGLLSLDDIRDVPRERQGAVHAADVMRDASELQLLGTQQDAVSALESLKSSPSHELPVVREGQFAGLLDQADVVRFLHTLGDDARVPV